MKKYFDEELIFSQTRPSYFVLKRDWSGVLTGQMICKTFDEELSEWRSLTAQFMAAFEGLQPAFNWCYITPNFLKIGKPVQYEVISLPLLASSKFY